MARVKTIPVAEKPHNLSEYPNFSKTGSIKGMKDKYYGKDALLVRCGHWIYNVSSNPHIYHELAH